MSQEYPPVQNPEFRQTTAANQPSGTGVPPQQPRIPTGPVGQRFHTRSHLPEHVRTTSIGLLNQCLADLSAVSMQLKDMHWNVKGVEFYQLHELFEDLAESFEPHIDAVAERASALGGQAFGTPHDVVQTSRIPQLPRGPTDGETLLDDLSYRLSRLDAELAYQIETATQQGDLDTADLLNEVSRDVSKALWFVEAHLQGPPSGPRQPTGQASAGRITGGPPATGGQQAPPAPGMTEPVPGSMPPTAPQRPD